MMEKYKNFILKIELNEFFQVFYNPKDIYFLHNIIYCNYAYIIIF